MLVFRVLQGGVFSDTPLPAVVIRNPVPRSVMSANYKEVTGQSSLATFPFPQLYPEYEGFFNMLFFLTYVFL